LSEQLLHLFHHAQREQLAVESDNTVGSQVVQQILAEGRAVRFRGAEQAETVRAQLAFEGFDSKITTNNGWNRVVIGPVKGKENADSTLNRLKMAGHTNCIRLAAGG